MGWGFGLEISKLLLNSRLYHSLNNLSQIFKVVNHSGVERKLQVKEAEESKDGLIESNTIR